MYNAGSAHFEAKIFQIIEVSINPEEKFLNSLVNVFKNIVKIHKIFLH